MTTVTVMRRPGRSHPTAPRIRLTCDSTGNWALVGSAAIRRYTDFESARDDAQRAANASAAAVEIWRGGEYVCCLPPEAAPATRRLRGEKDVLLTVERHADRAARIVMPIAGLLFWLSLMVIALAASLGWRLALL